MSKYINKESVGILSYMHTLDLYFIIQSVFQVLNKDPFITVRIINIS